MWRCLRSARDLQQPADFKNYERKDPRAKQGRVRTFEPHRDTGAVAGSIITKVSSPFRSSATWSHTVGSTRSTRIDCVQNLARAKEPRSRFARRGYSWLDSSTSSQRTNCAGALHRRQTRAAARSASYRPRPTFASQSRETGSLSIPRIEHRVSVGRILIFAIVMGLSEVVVGAQATRPAVLPSAPVARPLTLTGR